MTMGSLGHTQYRWIDLIQLSDLAGRVRREFCGDVRRRDRWRGCSAPHCRRPTPGNLLAAAAGGGRLAAALAYGHVRIAGN